MSLFLCNRFQKYHGGWLWSIFILHTFNCLCISLKTKINKSFCLDLKSIYCCRSILSLNFTQNDSFNLPLYRLDGAEIISKIEIGQVLKNVFFVILEQQKVFVKIVHQREYFSQSRNVQIFKTKLLGRVSTVQWRNGHVHGAVESGSGSNQVAPSVQQTSGF